MIDEVEHGLEPHRIIRLLGSLGAKDEDKPLQVFAATHSPVVVQELSGDQLFVIRLPHQDHEILPVGTSDEVQGTVRRYPEAFLAASIIVCEGASEVGLLRGIDQYRTLAGHESINAMGTALVNGGGIAPNYTNVPLPSKAWDIESQYSETPTWNPGRKWNPAS
ncbi:MAG: AAA family ATPase [Chloroflexi bacterium]|nr:AAA family ATPase [Chloroflexota bacterium]